MIRRKLVVFNWNFLILINISTDASYITNRYIDRGREGERSKYVCVMFVYNKSLAFKYPCSLK